MNTLRLTSLLGKCIRIMIYFRLQLQFHNGGVKGEGVSYENNPEKASELKSYIILKFSGEIKLKGVRFCIIYKPNLSVS